MAVLVVVVVEVERENRWCGGRDLNPGSPAWKAGVLVQARRPPHTSCTCSMQWGLFGFIVLVGSALRGLLSSLFLVVP